MLVDNLHQLCIIICIKGLPRPLQFLSEEQSLIHGENVQVDHSRARNQRQKTVGGGMHVLNQHSMRIRVGSLEYNFKYTDYAALNKFPEQWRAHGRLVTRDAHRLLDATP